MYSLHFNLQCLSVVWRTKVFNNDSLSLSRNASSVQCNLYCIKHILMKNLSMFPGNIDPNLQNLAQKFNKYMQEFKIQNEFIFWPKRKMKSFEMIGDGCAWLLGSFKFVVDIVVPWKDVLLTSGSSLVCILYTSSCIVIGKSSIYQQVQPKQIQSNVIQCTKSKAQQYSRREGNGSHISIIHMSSCPYSF